jgi:TRAP-type C4-dicarboxylate transport system permease small subunit
MSGSPSQAGGGPPDKAPDPVALEALAQAGVEIEGVAPAHAGGDGHSVVRVIDAISGVAGVVACLLLVAAAVIVCEMIFVRAVLGWNTIWQTEFTVYSATAAIFIGAPYVLAKKGHVGVDVVPMLVKGAARRWLARLANLLGFLYCAGMLYASWFYLHEAWVENWKTESVWAIPLWIPILPLVIGFGLLCLQYVAESIKLEGAAK